MTRRDGSNIVNTVTYELTYGVVGSDVDVMGSATVKLGQGVGGSEPVHFDLVQKWDKFFLRV